MRLPSNRTLRKDWLGQNPCRFDPDQRRSRKQGSEDYHQDRHKPPPAACKRLPETVFIQ